MAKHPNYLGRDYWLDPGDLFDEVSHDEDCDDEDCDGSCQSSEY